MSNLYSIESLLIGKAYRSHSVEGVITDAEPYTKAYYADADAYRVRVRPSGSLSDTYRIVAVAHVG